MPFFGPGKAITHKRTQTTTRSKQIMTDAQITALTNKLTAVKKATKDFLKMIEKTDISSKVEATVDEEHDDEEIYQVISGWDNDKEDEIYTEEFDTEEAARRCAAIRLESRNICNHDWVKIERHETIPGSYGQAWTYETLEVFEIVKKSK